MKFIIGRDFRNFSSPQEWITIVVTKEMWKKYGSRTNYLNAVFQSNWKVVFAGKNQIFSDDIVLTLLKKSFSEYFKNSGLLNEILTALQIPQNSNLKKNFKKDSIAQYSFDTVVTGLVNFFQYQKYLVDKDTVAKYINDKPEFFYSIPFIDPTQILRWDTRNQPWDDNSIESFLHNNLLIQVKLGSLITQENVVALFLRRDLKLGKGKAGAQLSHGIISLLYQPMFRNTQIDEFIKKEQKNILLFTVSDLKDLQEIEHLCLQNKVNNSLIIDAGHTQIEPGTATCIGVGPLPSIWAEILAFNIEAVELK